MGRAPGNGGALFHSLCGVASPGSPVTPASLSDSRTPPQCHESRDRRLPAGEVTEKASFSLGGHPRSHGRVRVSCPCREHTTQAGRGAVPWPRPVSCHRPGQRSLYLQLTERGPEAERGQGLAANPMASLWALGERQPRMPVPRPLFVPWMFGRDRYVERREAVGQAGIRPELHVRPLHSSQSGLRFYREL